LLADNYPGRGFEGAMQMSNDAEILSAALRMIRDHGPDAAGQAAMRAAKLLDEGDKQASEVWRAIATRIREITGAAG
jgi:hypothetical protein